jgi:hypothetical protein
VFVYYEGHGAYHPNAPQSDPSKGHYFALPDNELDRADLTAQIMKKRPRFVLLLSDCCNAEGSIKVRRRAVFETKTKSVTGWTGLEELLLSYRGIVDATASSRGELSWFSDDVGGWFTTSWFTKIYSLTEQKQRDWNKVWPELAQETEAFFQVQKTKFAAEDPVLAGQAHMRPMAFNIKVLREDPGDIPTNTREIMIPVQHLIDR